MAAGIAFHSWAGGTGKSCWTVVTLSTVADVGKGEWISVDGGRAWTAGWIFYAASWLIPRMGLRPSAQPLILPPPPTVRPRFAYQEMLIFSMPPTKRRASAFTYKQRVQGN
ncbi:hypothetical protein GCM10009765_10970 [Fodinicola feengrottensis]|uniref:Uncharacterized protein n=1 Tax=Fodinicola feengrottensis TaxID=435914 RepID=A0ABN2G0U5_9ACTN